MANKPLTEQATDGLETAYNSFKGGHASFSIPEKQEVVEAVETARIGSLDDGRWCVYVYVRSEDGEVPDIIERLTSSPP